MGTKNFSELTSFKIGGSIKEYFEVSNEHEVPLLISQIKQKKLPIFIIGGGTDVLVNDTEFNGAVIKYIGNKIQVTNDKINSQAGAKWDDVVNVAVENNLQGIECLSAIPGTSGAAPIQNIGAYGQEIKDTLIEIKAYDIENEKFVTFSNSECKFDYRESIFKKPSHWQKYFIVSITLRLNKDVIPNPTYETLLKNLVGDINLKSVREAVIKTRSQRLEDYDNFGNAGSFFKNPSVDEKKKTSLEKKFSDLKSFPFNGKLKIPAGWLVEKAGWKGREFGNAGVSPKHALILVNRTGNATAKEIYDLSEQIIKDVYNKFGIKLEREVQLINF